MRFHENEKCPVCDKIFNENDDIVTCPHCGTPHHRECYNSLGHCINADKHADGFEYKAEPQTAAQDSDDDNAYYAPSVSSNTSKAHLCEGCGKEIPADAPFCAYCGARQSSPRYEAAAPVRLAPQLGEEQAYSKSAATIDGKSAGDVASVIRTNTSRFIPAFIKNKKFSWNWAGFFFGPFYLFFRKMNKEGILALAIRTIASLVAQGIYAEQYATVSKFLNDNYQALTQNPNSELVNNFMLIYKDIVPMLAIILAANIIINVIIALFADRLYRVKVFKVLDKVYSVLEEGGSFNQTNPFMMNEAPLSQEEMKKLYLGKMGGTSIFSPIIAWLALDLITNLISRL